MIASVHAATFRGNGAECGFNEDDGRQRPLYAQWASSSLQPAKHQAVEEPSGNRKKNKRMEEGERGRKKWTKVVKIGKEKRLKEIF